MEAQATVRRLTKSRQDRMIDGVCGGIARYAGIDPTLVRLAFLLLVLFKGIGVLLYVAGMILMPAAPRDETAAESSEIVRRRTNTRFWGILLVIVGIVWLMSNLGWMWWMNWWGVSWELGIPVLLILAGVGFLFGGRGYIAAGGPADEKTEGQMDANAGEERKGASMRRLTRSQSEKKLFGVCGGIGVYLGVDPTVIRLLFVIAVFATEGAAILIYLLMALLVPRETIPMPSPSSP